MKTKKQQKETVKLSSEELFSSQELVQALIDHRNGAKIIEDNDLVKNIENEIDSRQEKDLNKIPQLGALKATLDALNANDADADKVVIDFINVEHYTNRIQILYDLDVCTSYVLSQKLVAYSFVEKMVHSLNASAARYQERLQEVKADKGEVKYVVIVNPVYAVGVDETDKVKVVSYTEAALLTHEQAYALKGQHIFQHADGNKFAAEKMERAKTFFQGEHDRAVRELTKYTDILNNM